MFPGVDGAGTATKHQILAGELALRDMLNTTPLSVRWSHGASRD
jgi:hypothetical protein